jgi:hypothetical protein
MTNRREFFGQVIGISVASGLPFHATPARPTVPLADPLNEYERIIELLRAPRQLQERCRLILRLHDGVLLEGPRMARIEQPSPIELAFYAEDFTVTRELLVSGFQLVNWKNELITERPFSGGWQRLLGPEENKAQWEYISAKAGKTPRPPEWLGDTLKASHIIRLGHD